MFSRISTGIMSLVMLISSLLGIPIGGKTVPEELITYDSKKTSAIIALASNPSTGYDWEYEISDPAVIKVTDDQFVSGSSAGLAGAPGTRVISFKGLKAGTATVTFNYLRSWEADPPIDTVVIKITVASDKTLTAEEIPLGEIITDIEQVAAAYNAACAATKEAPQGQQTLKLNGAITADGALGVLLRFLSPFAEKALANNTMETDYIPGNPPILADDVTEASLISANGTTTILIKLKDQVDGMDANENDGPVGRGVGTLGNLGSALTELGASAEEGNDTVAMTYTNASIRCTVDEATGAITGGTWHYTVDLHVDNAVITLSGLTLRLKNAAASLDYDVVI